MKVCERDYRTVVGVRREKMEKQIGCMSGFLQIFDRQQILAGKRIHSTKRLPPSTGVGESLETGSSGESHEFSRSPNISSSSPTEKMTGRSKSPSEKMNCRSKSPVTVPAFENNGVKQKSSLKSYKEIRRHSLDSRITITASNTPAADVDDNQQRYPSVIARLMGLEQLPSPEQKPPQTVAKPVLRRSVSEPRISRNLIYSKYIDDNNFQVKQPNKSQKESVKRIVRDDRGNVTYVSNKKIPNCRACKSMNSESSRTSPCRSRSFFDSTEFYPDPNQLIQQTNDLSTLKQILEVLQLKGLPRSMTHQNFVFHRNQSFNEPNIILVKPSRSSASKSDSQRTRRWVSENPPETVRPCSPNRIEGNLKACNLISKTKSQSKHKPTRNGSVRGSSINRSPINPPKQKLIKKVVTKDESSSISAPSTTDSERSKWKRCREGKGSLQRFDTESPASSAVVVPSPVSVLDSGFDKDEPSSSSHGIDLKATPAVDFKDHKLPPTKSTEREEFTSHDPNFIYISEIIEASNHLPEDSTVFFSIENQLYNTKNKSNVSKHQRKLIFDVVLEIINRNKQLPPWKQPINDSRPSVKQIWSEFQKIREVNTGEGVLELVTGVIEKDIVEINDWRDYSMEMLEAVKDIERLIFKDLVGEVIRDVVELSSECVLVWAPRKLVF